MQSRYLVVFGACLTQFTVIGLLFSYGLFFKVFEDEFGWSRTILSSCTSLAFLMMGVLAVFVGRLNDRYGPRIVLSVSGVLYGFGFVLMSQISAPWQLFLIFAIFIGLGMSTHDVVTLSTIARWFEKRRGAMTGLVKVGTALGQIAIPQAAVVLIAGFGWRPAVIILGVAASVLLLAAALSMRSPPQKQAEAAAAEATGLSIAEARGTRAFWTLCVIQFLFLPSLTTIPLHIVAHGVDLGLTTERAAIFLSVSAAASIAGRLTIGTLADRIGGRKAYVLCFTPLIIGLIGLLLTENPIMLFAVLAIYGFGHGGFFTVVSPTIAEIAGTRAHGAIFGNIVFFGTIGGALGPILAGWIFDVSGSYTYAFATLLAMAVIGLALSLTLPRKAA